MFSIGTALSHASLLRLLLLQAVTNVFYVELASFPSHIVTLTVFTQLVK